MISRRVDGVEFSRIGGGRFTGLDRERTGASGHRRDQATVNSLDRNSVFQIFHRDVVSLDKLVIDEIGGRPGI